MKGSIENSGNFFLIISGPITHSKKKEFEQTYRLAFSVKTEDCLVYNLSTDTSIESYYYFFSLWTSDLALKKFMKSTEFELMNGAFHALGHIEHLYTGNLSETKNLINQYNY